MRTTRLINRFNWYYPTERFFAFLCTGLIGYVVAAFDSRNTVFLVYGLVLTNSILYQGQHYWRLKLDRVANKTGGQPEKLRLFRKAEVLNRAMIGLIPAALLTQLRLSGGQFKMEGVFFWAVVANTFAVLEYINYYHLQLTIDNLSDLKYLLKYKKLKQASLKKDLFRREIVTSRSLIQL